ncbi:MAG: TRAP transporter substrate-binding protein [Desulfobacterales bacterium]
MKTSKPGFAAGTRAIVAWVGLLLAGIPTAAATELKLAHFMPTVHTLHQEVFLPLAEKVSQTTHGALTIKIYPSGALGKGPVQQYKRAVTGVADITFIIQSYSSAIFPRSLIATQPGVTRSAEQGTRRLWELYDPYLQDDYAAVKVLGIWVMSPTVLMTRDRPVSAVGDLQGMKARISSPVESHLIRSWGAVPVAMPITESYNALNSGVVDAVLIQPSALYQPWNLAEPAQYVTTNLPSPTSIVGLIMNKESWEALPADQQAALDRLTGPAFSIQASILWSRKDVAALEKARGDSGISVIELPAAERIAFETAARSAIDDHLAQLEKEGIHARDIYQVFKR